MELDRTSIGIRISILSLIGNLVLAVVKLLAGVIAGSSAMVADSVHSLSDSLSTVTVMIGIKISGRPPDKDHHYGHARAETVAAKLVATLLIVTALGVGASSWRQLFLAAEAPTSLAVAAAVLSIFVKEAMYRYTQRTAVQIRSKALKADAQHHRADALSSVTALVGIVGAQIGFPLLDPMAGLVVAAMVLFSALRLYWRSIEELVDTAPNQETMNAIMEAAETVPGVIRVSSVQARCFGENVFVDVVIVVDGRISVYSGHQIAQSTSTVIRQLGRVERVLVHVNPCCSAGCEHCES